MTGHPAVPDVIIGGAPRSGTTFLCDLLSKHPDVYVTRPFIPEPKVCMTPHPAGDAGLLNRYATLFAAAPRSAVRVEKTSYYLENQSARERLVRILPRAKFIFIFREPVARAYSNWLISRANGLEPLPFVEAIALEGRRPSPLPPDRAYARPFDYMLRGQYGSLVEKWICAVGRERLAFYLFESMLTDPEHFVGSVQRFIGVKHLPWSTLMTTQVNASETAEPIDSALAAALRHRIAPEVRHFEAVTGLDVSVWGY